MRVSDNGRYLVGNDGTPFFYLADTAWKLFYELTREEADEYLQNRRNKGFTVIMPCLLAECGSKERFGTVYGDEPLLELDPTKPNEAFFRHADYIINKTNELGMYVALLPTWGEFVGPQRWGRGPVIFNEQNAYIYGKFLGNRYKDNRIIWVLGGDRNPETDELVKVWRAMAAGLKDGDEGRHLITYHPMALCSSAEWLHDEPWLDFNMIQTGVVWDHDNYNMILKDYKRLPVKPVVDGEARYENSHEFFAKRPPCGRHVTAHQVRKAAYNSVLSGAMGHTYGCRDVWSYYDPSKGGPTRDVTLPWRTAVDLPGAYHMGYLRKFVTDYPFHKLVPDIEKKLVVHGSQEGATYVPCAISEDKDYALAYVPEKQAIYVNMSVLNGEKIHTAWYNPRTGTYIKGEAYNSSETFVKLCPPDTDPDPDYCLVLSTRPI